MDLHLQAIVINFIVLIILLFYLRYDWSLMYASMTDQDLDKLKEFLKRKERLIRLAIWLTSLTLVYLIGSYLIR